MKKIPTKEEYYKKLFEGERGINTKWSEDYAKAFLQSIGSPIVHTVDGNPKYQKRAKGLCTPDFIIGKNSIGDNDPDDFYIDIQEVTGGPWDIKKKKSPLFKHGNPARIAEENLRDSEVGYENAQRVAINEFSPEILKAIFKPINKKSHKYGQRKRKSSKFGLISVQSPTHGLDRKLHYSKLIWSVFESIIIELRQLGVNQKELSLINNLRNQVLSGQKDGLIPISLPFKNNTWCFWALLGVNYYYGQCIFLVNQSALKRYEDDTDEVISWVNKLSMSEGFSFINELEQIFSESQV